MNTFIKVVGTHDLKTVDQMRRCVEDPSAVAAVLCADGHLGYSQPVGGVIAYKDKISISGVGYDIACGNLAIKTDIKWDEIKDSQVQLADDVQKHIAFGVGQDSHIPFDGPIFDHAAWRLPHVKDLKDLARKQGGSGGSSNHFLNVFVDDDAVVWIGCHFGSRGLGHHIASTFLKFAGGKDGIDQPPTLVEATSTLGLEYQECLDLASKYAYAGREAVCNYVVNNILRCQVVDVVHNNHNFAWKETHNNEDVWVVRKGTTPAFPGQRGFIGGSMGDNSVIVKGIDSPFSKELLYSTVHGAGRVLSRTQASGKSKWLYNEELGKKVKTRVSKGLVDEDEMRKRIEQMGIELRGGGADEAPEVYRPLKEVLEYHKGSIEIESVLQPKIVIMA